MRRPPAHPEARARPVRRVALIAKLGPAEGPRLARELAAWLRGHAVEVIFDEETARALSEEDGLPAERLPAGLDLAIVAGGDGTLLRVARAAAPRGIPVLGVNFGSLGFLTELQPDEIYRGLEAVLDGAYRLEERQMLRVRYERAGHAAQEYLLLNDAVVTKGALARMIELLVFVDGEEIARYFSDGLIVATPTGSTAYNLSAGGPILDPRMRAFVIAPICPHTMTYRPLVVPESVTIEVRLGRAVEEVYLTLDGQIGLPFGASDRVRLEAHPDPVRLVRVTGRSFFEILRRKLRWGER